MFSAIAGAVSDAVENVTDAAAGMFGGEQAKPLIEAKNQLNSLVESLSEPQQMLGNVSNAAGGVPMESATAAKDQFTTLTGTFKEMVEGDPKKLLPPGAGCAASRWANSIKKNLTALSKEAEDLMGTVVSTPDKAKDELLAIKGSLDGASEGMAAVAKVMQDAAGTLKECVTSMDKLKELGSTLEGVETNFADVLAKARGSLEGVNNSLANTPGLVVTMVEGLIDKVDTFNMRAPKKVVAAFKAPFPCCCLNGGKAGEAQDKLETGLNTLGAAVNLNPLLEGIKSIKTKMEGLDTSKATAALDAVESGFSSALAPAKEAAAKIAEMTGGD